MARVPPELPRDSFLEDQLQERIQSLNSTLQETLQQLAEAKTELEIRRSLAYGIMPTWLRPAKLKSLAEIATNVLAHNWQGLKFAEIANEIQRAGREVHKPSLTATLGRLKREEKIVRSKGRWKIATYANQTLEPEEPPEKEYEKEEYMD
jgi:G3E family GTPase